MNSARVSFPCGDIVLEGEWHLPRGKPPFPVIVVCHPHPLHGGDMHNNVVITICRELPRNSIAAFRFNFRGVGNSGGSFGEGIAEVLGGGDGSGFWEKKTRIFRGKRRGNCWLFSRSLWFRSAGQRWWRNAEGAGFIRGWNGWWIRIPQSGGRLVLRGDWRCDTRLMPPKRRMGKLREGVRAEGSVADLMEGEN